MADPRTPSAGVGRTRTSSRPDLPEHLPRVESGPLLRGSGEARPPRGRTSSNTFHVSSSDRPGAGPLRTPSAGVGRGRTSSARSGEAGPPDPLRRGWARPDLPGPLRLHGSSSEPATTDQADDHTARLTIHSSQPEEGTPHSSNKDVITICQENLKEKGQNKEMTQQIGSSILCPSCNLQSLLLCRVQGNDTANWQ